MRVRLQQCRHRGYLPLWMALVLAGVVVIALTIWTMRAMSTETPDGRETIVFWGGETVGQDIYAIVNQFEQLPENLDPVTHKPKYKVILGNATSPDITGDAQRLLCAIAGEVPPDVVWFDRFAIGEFAGHGALENLLPYIKRQRADDPYRLNLDDYYQWAVQETSYKRPGSYDEAGIYGVPWEVDMRLLYSNGDLLRQEGFVDPKSKEPLPPKTWEELRQYANALTRYKNPNDKSAGIARLGFAPNFGNSWLYMFAWEAGGEFMSPDLTKVTLDSPPVARALRFMTDVYDDLGGFPQVDGFQQSFQSASLDPFLRGNVAMKIDTTFAMTFIGEWRRDMDFIVTPAPMPADRLAEGRKPITWGGGYSIVMPATARNKEGAWRLIKYISSAPVRMQLERGRREFVESQGGMYLPQTMANRVVFEQLLHDYIENNPKLPSQFRQAYAVVKDMMPNTLHRPVTPVGQLLWNQHRRAYDDGVHHKFKRQAQAEMAAKGITDPDKVEEYEMHLALANAQSVVQSALDEVLQPLPKSTKVNWTPWFFVYGALVLLPFVGILVAFKRYRRTHFYSGRELAAGMMFASPWIIGFIVFVGGPIFFSILFAFTRFDVLSPAHWVGLDNFHHLTTDPLFSKSLGNTAFMIIRIPLTMAVSLIIAMLLNNALRGMGFYRTACYMPAIVPLVASSLLWVWIFNPSQGLLNNGIRWIIESRPIEWLQAMLHIHLSAPLWLQDENWSKPSLILMNIWGAGGGIIIWLAGLQSIPNQLYEAAAIDGCTPWRRFWNVTVPMLSPYILFNFIIGVIGTMQIFNEAFVMTQGGPANSTLFYAYHLFQQAFQYFRMGYASSLAWILFLMVLALTILQLWLSKRWVHYDRT
jgi:multiple sugar transport system permease protein